MGDSSEQTIVPAVVFLKLLRRYMTRMIRLWNRITSCLTVLKTVYSGLPLLIYRPVENPIHRYLNLPPVRTPD